MSDDSKPLVPTMREALATAEVAKQVIEVIDLRAGGSLNLTRTEAIISVSTHHSISAEVMTLGVKEAEARAAAATAQFAVPAQERTKRARERTWQLAVACVAVLLVVGIGAYASVQKPEVAPYLMGMVMVIVGVVGAVYGLDLWTKRGNPSDGE